MATHRKDEPVGSFVTFGSFGSFGSFVTFGAFVVLTFASTLLVAQQSEAPSILISRQLAELEQIAVGDEVQLATSEQGTDARAFRVAGIYEPTPDPMRLGAVPREVRLHLTDLLALEHGTATPAGTEHVESINVALQNPDEAQAFAADVNARIPGVFARTATGAAGSGSTFVVLERFHL